MILALPSGPRPELPQGVLAIASGLGNLVEAEIWAEGAACAQAWSFRLPRCSDRVALEILSFLRARAPWLAVHGRQDWAVCVGANAVIQGARSLRPDTWPGVKIPVWLSAHETKDLTGKSPAFFGPVWETPEKKGVLQARGIARLQVAASLAPIFALGGIESQAQVRACRQAGVQGIAVLRAARDPALLQELVTAWSE